MYVLLILMSRYLFVFYIAYFLWLCFRDEKYVTQRVIVYLMHVTAFGILAFDKNTFEPQLSIIYIGLASLLILILLGICSRLLYKESSPRLWNCEIFLLSIGIAELTRLNPMLAERQVIWLFCGAVVTVLLPLVFKLFRSFEKLKYFYLAVIVIMLGSVLFLGREEYGAVIGINILGFSFQPVEIVKLVFVFYLSSALCNASPGIKSLIKPTCVSGAVVLLQVYLKDLGGALIFFMTYMILMYVSTGNAVLFFSGFTLASAASAIAYRIFPHIRVRVSAWSNPWANPTDNGYQIVQGFFSIGTYGLMGSGLSLGYPHYVPVVERDFVFAAICEEFGSLFGGLLIIVYIVMFYLCVKIALNAENKFYSLLASGIVTVLAVQTFLILGGIVKLIPLTGVTLPFISYGGSSLIACMFMTGIVQMCVSKERSEENESDFGH